MSIKISEIKKLPDSPGVYFFKKGKEVLYIGKATSLKNRVRSYFSKELWRTRSTLIADMMVLADNVTFQKTDSVLEALVLEAELIKKYKPYHNTKEKDDKSHLNVIITNEDFPILKIIRKRDLDDMKVRESLKIKYEFGPFTSGPTLREALKIIRRIFPYRDEKCMAGSGKPCFNYQIGLCPGCCIGKVSKKEYGMTVRNIALFFKGKKKELIKELKKEMNVHAKNLEFEIANKIKRQIFALNHINDVSLMKRENMAENSSSDKTFRIEAYDVAHMQGSDMTGVMTVIEDGITNKAEYRMFKIKRKGINDVASLKEILERRMKHSEWRFPDLIVTDGGLPQYNVAKDILEKNSKENISIVGVVKNERHRPERMIGNEEIIKLHQNSILLANAEAHRFTLKYHRKLRGKSVLPKS